MKITSELLLLYHRKGESTKEFGYDKQYDDCSWRRGLLGTVAAAIAAGRLGSGCPDSLKRARIWRALTDAALDP